ncbi:MAG: hypothetical protein LBR71_00275 [Synergistaceae bacterium]|nr:hypothetical protein [Synergistaceae bacterium]
MKRLSQVKHDLWMKGVCKMIEPAPAEGVDEVMTDYQFKTILKMVLNIVEETRDIDKIEKSLRDLIGEPKRKEPQEQE